MSALAWLLPALESAKLTAVTTCNQPENLVLVTGLADESLIDKGLGGFVTSVTSVTSKKQLPVESLADVTDWAANETFSPYSLPTRPDTDDRITCRQCQHLTYGGICSIAYPGGTVSAQKGYRPSPDLLQRCTAYESKPTKGIENEY